MELAEHYQTAWDEIRAAETEKAQLLRDAEKIRVEIQSQTGRLENVPYSPAHRQKIQARIQTYGELLSDDTDHQHPDTQLHAADTAHREIAARNAILSPYFAREHLYPIPGLYDLDIHL